MWKLYKKIIKKIKYLKTENEGLIDRIVELKQENIQLKAQVERMKEDIEELKSSSFDAGMFFAVDEVLIKWKKNNIDEVEE